MSAQRVLLERAQSYLISGKISSEELNVSAGLLFISEIANHFGIRCIL